MYVGRKRVQRTLRFGCCPKLASSPKKEQEINEAVGIKKGGQKGTLGHWHNNLARKPFFPLFGEGAGIGGATCTYKHK